MSDLIEEMVKVEADARSFGFSYPDYKEIIKQIQSECAEVAASIEQGESLARQQEEIGDLIHAVIALCYHQGFDVAQTMEQATHKFSNRMTALKQVAKKRGLSNPCNVC